MGSRWKGDEERSCGAKMMNHPDETWNKAEDIMGWGAAIVALLFIFVLLIVIAVIVYRLWW